MFMNKQQPEGGFYADGGGVDPVSGNEVPRGSLKEEVRDDVSAKLSPGEFVLPADVVRYIGLERLMKLRDEAKAGLARMENIGQMGNAEEVKDSNQAFEGEEEDTSKFESDIDELMKEEEEGGEEKELAAGGFLTGEDLSRAPKNPMVDVRYFKNSKDKRIMFITYINGKPTTAIPKDFEPYDPTTEKAEEATTPKTTTGKTATGATREGDGGVGKGADLTQSQIDFLDSETPAERDARMGKISDIISKAVSTLPAVAVLNKLADTFGLAPNKGTPAMEQARSTFRASERATEKAAADETAMSTARTDFRSMERATEKTEAEKAEEAAQAAREASFSGDGGYGGFGGTTGGGDTRGFGGEYARGGLVPKRQLPAKKQKGKGIAASKR